MKFTRTNTPVDTFTPMKVEHYQRTIPSCFKTKEVVDMMYDGDFNIQISSAMMNDFDGFIDWLFIHGYSYGRKHGKFKTNNKEKDELMSVSHTDGQATMIFGSNFDSKDLIKICEQANMNRTDNLFFYVLSSFNGVTDENVKRIVNYLIKSHPDKHLVLFSKRLGSRSFSVPEIVNVCIMINDPSFDSVVQKMARNQTPDGNKLNKVAKIYWFNLNKITCPICPMWEYVKNTKQYVVTNSFNADALDTVNIFMETDDGEYMSWDKVGNPFNEYLDRTANTYYRMAENLELKLSNEQRERLYEIFSNLDLNNLAIVGTTRSTKLGKKDAKVFEGYKNAKNGGTTSNGGTNSNSGNTIDSVEQLIINAKNIIINVMYQYKRHDYLVFENFITDFIQTSHISFTQDNIQHIHEMYDLLLDAKLI